MTQPAEQPNSGIAVLAEDSPDWEDGPFKVRGVALTSDITTNGNAKGNEVYWPDSVVESATEFFEGAKIVDPTEHDPETAIKNPQPSPETIIGEITTARYEDGKILYQGEVDDPEIAKRIERGRVEVSPTIFRTVEEGNVSDVKGVRDLSVVARGQVPGNDISPATAAMSALSAEALSGIFAETLEADISELSEGDLVSWNSSGDRDAYGMVEGTITEGQYDSEIDGDVTVDAPAALITVHTPGSDGWEATEQQVAHKPGTLKTVEALPDPESLAKHYDEKPSSMAELPGKYTFDNPGEAMAKADDMGFDEIHSHGEGDDTTFMPGPTHEDLVDKLMEMGEMGGETMGAESPVGTSTSDDGTQGGTSPSSVGDSDLETMSDNELTDGEKALLEAVNDPEEAAETLRDFQSHEEPKIVEQTEVEAMEDRVSTLETMMNERLEKDTGLKEATIEAMSFEAKAAEFETDDGEFDAESLIQTPETGNPEDDPEQTVEVETLMEEVGASDKTEAVETLKSRYQQFERAGWDGQAEDVADKLETLGVEV